MSGGAICLLKALVDAFPERATEDTATSQEKRRLREAAWETISLWDKLDLHGRVPPAPSVKDLARRIDEWGKNATIHVPVTAVERR